MKCIVAVLVFHYATLENLYKQKHLYLLFIRQTLEINDNESTPRHTNEARGTLCEVWQPIQEPGILNKNDSREIHVMLSTCHDDLTGLQEHNQNILR